MLCFQREGNNRNGQAGKAVKKCPIELNAFRCGRWWSVDKERFMLILAMIEENNQELLKDGREQLYS